MKNRTFPLYFVVNYGHLEGTIHDAAETSVHRVTSPTLLGGSIIQYGNTLTPESDEFMSHNTI